MHWSLVPAGLLAIAVGCAQTADPSPELLTLARIKLTASQTLSRQPNYTCVQQIERSNRRLPKRKFELHDLLRIEVALVDGKEMFAWPGAHKFEQTDLTKMVADGAIGTGDFAMHARSVFQSSAPTFKHIGQALFRGHNADRYDYIVPLISSGYRIKSGGREAVVGYHGSFWADAETHELLRLEVNADDIPAEIGVATVQDIMDYDRVKIGASDFLLPIGSDLSMTDLLGNQNRNRTQFKSCRQYTGESTLTFAEAPSADDAATEPDAATPVAPQLKANVEIPAGTTLDIRLTSEIDSETAAIGDVVTAALEQNVKLGREMLFRKGAILHGRVLRLERHREYTTLDLQFSEIESDDRHSNVLAKVDELATQLPAGTVRSMFYSTERNAHPDGIHVRGNRIHLQPGSRLRLRTLAPAPPPSAS